MTLIECFDTFAPQNIAGCLYLQPQKLMLLGDRDQIRQYLPRYRALLARRGIQTQLGYRHVDMDDLESLVRQLTGLLRQKDEFVIDIAGGDERLLFAVGVALGSLDSKKRKGITVQRFDPLTGMAKSLSGNAPSPLTPVRLGIEELVQLQGGILHPSTPQPARHYTAADLDPLWALVRQDARSWNKAIGILRELESRADSETQVYLPLWVIQGSIHNFESKLATVRRLLRQLEDCGAIVDHSRDDRLEYTYTSPLTRAATLKAGNALEIKVLLEARDLWHQGQPYFHDCHMGVQIDWDGVVHDPAQRIPETRNEIDLVVVRGMTPLFISCKNGDIGEAELYKLHTVATQFGGPQARKMLIATDLDGKKPGSGGAFIQRARDMDICFVEDAASLDKQGWQKILLDAMQPPKAGG